MLRFRPLTLSVLLTLPLFGCGDDNPEFNFADVADASDAAGGDTAGSDGGSGEGDGQSDVEADAESDTEADIDADIESDVQEDASVEACEWQIVQEIENPNPGGGFGQAIAASESRVAVAVLEDTAEDIEWVNIFQSSGAGTFELEQQLQPVAGGSQGYGRGLSLVGDRLVVGASIGNAAYVYEFAGEEFTEVAVIEGPSPGTSFGSAVTQLDDRIFIGAGYDSAEASWAGAIFEALEGGTGFGEPTRITSGLEAEQYVGRTLSTNGEVLVAGGISNARVYAPLDGSALTEVVLDGDTERNERFGEAVLATDSWLFVGAPGEIGAEAQGEVVIFERIGEVWNRADTLAPSAPTGGLLFGIALAGHDELVAVGASSLSRAFGSDQVYLFAPSDEGGWEEVAVFDSPVTGSEVETSFGAAVAVSGGRVFIGDPWRETGGEGTGVVFVVACE